MAPKADEDSTFQTMEGTEELYSAVSVLQPASDPQWAAEIGWASYCLCAKEMETTTLLFPG